MLTYSVKPRGGVVHALEVAEALARRGHDATLAALSAGGAGLFRPTALPVRLIAHAPDPAAPFDARIAAMIDAYRDGLATLGLDGFDVVHAQDCLSANAALALRDAGLVDRVVRTVHHVDDFLSPSLVACQHRSIVGPDHLLCVSAPWRETLRRDHGVHAEVVGNGVDALRHARAARGGERAAARARLGLAGRHVVLSIGGIEPRKGTVDLLEAVARLRDRAPALEPLLLVAGGATLFDYRAEIDRFAARRAALGMDADVRVLGPRTPAELDDLLAASDVFAFPSVREGFGLVALEALAAGLPLVASDLDVLRGFLTDGHSALLVSPGDPDALAGALARTAAEPELRARLRVGGDAVVAAHTWDAVAAAHERAYAGFARSARTVPVAAGPIGRG